MQVCINPGGKKFFFSPHFLFPMALRILLVLNAELNQCFSTFVRPRPGKFFFHRTRAGPNKFTRQYLSNFFSKFIH